MCVDANRGAREAARQRRKEKDFAYAQEGLKFFNREANYEKTLDANVIGYSRSISDAYSKALYTQAKCRKELENATKLYFSKKSANEGGRSRRFGLKQYQALLQAKAEVQGINRTNFGRNMAVAQEGARRQFQNANAQAREDLGLPPIYGMPVMMPPKDRLTGAIQVIQTGVALAAPFVPGGSFNPTGAGIFNFSGVPTTSDRRLKENIKQVGVSPQGYKIYEFNYIGGDVRFRGAMAQDVLMKNPMAVGIDQNHLTVDYRKIDVAMEVV